MTVRSFLLPVYHHPQAKKRQKSGRWNFNFTPGTILRTRRKISWLLLKTKRGELSGILFVAYIRTVDPMLYRFINIHLLNLRDGSPHKIPLKKVLQLNTGNCRGFLLNAQIGDSRIALVVGFLRPNDESRRELIAWDWRTGEVVGRSFFHRTHIIIQLQPRYSNTRTMTRVSAVRSPVSPLYIS